MRSKKIGHFPIAMTFIGTLIGAGFASGQEMLQFFSGYGFHGVIGACMVAFCFSFLGIVSMMTARNLGTNAYEIVVSPNPVIRVFMNVVITFFSFGVITVMLAGSGSLANTILGWDPFWGSAVMVIVTALVAMCGSEGLVNSFSVVVPVIVVIEVIAGGLAIVFGSGDVMGAVPHLELTAASNWAVAGLLFVSYNTICAIAVLVPLGYEAQNAKDVVWGSVLGGAVLGGVTTILCVAMLRNFQISVSGDMPMYMISVNINPYLGYAYAFVLFAAIFTTAAGLMYGLTMRLKQYDTLITRNKALLVLTVSALALIGSRVGFTVLIGTLYPLTGYLGFLIIVSLVYSFFHSRKKKRRL